MEVAGAGVTSCCFWAFSSFATSTFCKDLSLIFWGVAKGVEVVDFEEDLGVGSTSGVIELTAGSGMSVL